MYLEKAIFINRAPFEHLELDFIDKGVNVLSAINGKGKTTILSHIVDAFYEFARGVYSNSFEGRENKYYRVSSSSYNLVNDKCSIVYFRFKEDTVNYDYIDINGMCSEQEYNQMVTIDGKIAYNDIKSSLEERLSEKYVSKIFDKEKIRLAFSTNLLTYFPAYRYEQPGYLNAPYKINLKFKTDVGYGGELPNPIEVVTGLTEFSGWLMDVVLDKQVYTTNPKHQVVFNNINNLFNQALKSKLKERVRIGIGARHDAGNRIGIMSAIVDNKQIYPNIFNLSSGELSILTLFGEILRQSDKLGAGMNATGIVLIDEVDKHLHIKLQNEILPKLMQLFPNIQFIVSSHSPFFNMGLAQHMPDNSRIVDLDNNGIICSPQSNELYMEVYDMMINENSRFAKKYQQISHEISTLSKAIVITEGKTDIKHIMKAKEMLSIEGVDFDCIELDCQPSGDSELKKLLDQLAKVKRSNKIIGIFDRDLPNTVKDIEKDDQKYKDYGNDVYAFCIKSPQCRVDNKQTSISIEYLYTDEEIRTKLPNGCRLFFGSEFNKKTGRHNTSKTMSLANQSDRGEDKIVENNGGQAVYNEEEENVLAKKDDFANAIGQDEVPISKDSWSNFTHIFETIETIIN